MSSIVFTPRAWATAGVVAAASAMNSAHAGIIMTTNPIITPPETSLPLPVRDGEVPRTFTVNQFDPTLGTLQAIELSFGTPGFSSAELGPQAFLSECSYEGSSVQSSCIYAFGVTFEVASTVTTPDGTEEVQKASGAGNDSLVVEFDSREAGLSPFFTADISVESPFVSLPLGLGTTPFIPYVGSGTWDLDFETQLSKVAFSSTCVGEGDSQCDPTDPKTGAFGGKVFWNLENITVTYTYMASVEVPVPAPLWLFGAGLAAAAAVTRRKNRN